MCLHPSCQISHFHFVFGFAMMCGCPISCWCDLCPLGPFRSRFAPHHDQWPSIRRHQHMSSCLPSSSSDLSFLPFGWFDTSLCYCRVQFSKARLMFEELKYWFVKTWGICWSMVVKAVPSCGGDYLRRQVQELHALMTSSISDFGCIIFMFMFSLVLSVNSPNATTLHSRCIWEGVLRVL